jgi:flavin reductase (DIM6/NTAB) family NADH-FMN oxidoreductase RutF
MKPDAHARIPCEPEVMADVPVPTEAPDRLIELPVGADLWERVFTVAPLVLVGTKERNGWNFAPKHLAMPLGWEGFYCFACTPRHATYRNLQAHPEFTVSFPGTDQIIESSLAAGGRFEGDVKPTLAAVPTAAARVVDGLLVDGCQLYLECELERIVDGFGPASLIVGRVVAASAAREALRGAEVDDADLVHTLGLLTYLSPGRFAVVRESLSFPYPVGFRR